MPKYLEEIWIWKRVHTPSQSTKLEDFLEVIGFERVLTRHNDGKAIPDLGKSWMGGTKIEPCVQATESTLGWQMCVSHGGMNNWTQIKRNRVWGSFEYWVKKIVQLEG